MIKADLQALGYNQTNQKYVVWFEDTPVPGIGGQGDLYGNSSDSINNPNNLGPSYAILYDYEEGNGDTVLHEMGHTLGAVQGDAPDATGVGYWHCRTEWDVMCYDDSAPGGISSYACTGNDGNEKFDCQFNSYMNAGSNRSNPSLYIGTHWNVTECYVRFVANFNC